MPRESYKSLKETGRMIYMWEGVPRDLILAARAKCKADGTNLKAKLLELVRAWLAE